MKQSFGDFNSSIESDFPSGGHQVELIPCPYEETTTYGKGTANGPEAIITASQELEFYDDELDFDISEELGFKTLEPVVMPLQDAKTAEPFGALYDVCKDSYIRNKFPIVLGGEHSLSLGSVKAAYDYSKEQGQNLTLLHFDAHADLRQEYEGNPHNHACAIYQIYKACPDIQIISVGIRNISRAEMQWLQNISEDQIKIFYARDQKTNVYKVGNNKTWTAESVVTHASGLANKMLYVTFDVDGLASNLMPSTGTPEPGGLDWYTPVNIISEITKSHQVIGADVVELSPISTFHAPDFLAAKLVYKIASLARKSKA